MQNKPLLFGLIGFLLGGLLVSIAATFQSPTTDMTRDLQSKTGDAYDKAFMEMMIEHHQSAVDMAKLSQSRAKHDEVKQLSDDIMLTQKKEITQMQQWQKQWGYKQSSDNSSHKDMDM